jgi:hypothetical protein
MIEPYKQYGPYGGNKNYKRKEWPHLKDPNINTLHPTRHQTKRLNELENSILIKQQKIELEKINIEHFWNNINYDWKIILAVINKSGLDYYIELLEDKRSHWTKSDIRREILNECFKNRTQDKINQLEREERQAYLKCQIEIEKLKIPCSIEYTKHNEQALQVFNYMYDINKKKKLINVIKKY